MRHSTLSTLAAMVMLASPALAMSPPVRDCHPYWVVMRCAVDMPSCSRPHMTYQRGAGLADSPNGNYLYYTPRPESNCDNGCGRRAHHARSASAHHSRGKHRWSGYRSPASYYNCHCGHTHNWWPAN